jgi:hypothetical protein
MNITREELQRIIEEELQTVLDEKCQKGYKTHEKRKTKKMFGKTYRNCVKAEESMEMEEDIDEAKAYHWDEPDWEYGGGYGDGTLEEKKKKKKKKKKAKAKKKDGKSSKDKGYNLNDWFKGGGWVQAGGKYDGKPCAKQPGQKTKPYCRDPDDRSKLSKADRDKRAAKKRKKDPNPNRKGKAKNVSQKDGRKKR